MPLADRPRLPTLDDKYNPIPGQTATTIFWVRLLGKDVPWPIDAPNELVPPLHPIVNHGQWIIRCPDCPSAQLAAWEDRRFYCAETTCPRPYGTTPYRVQWPTDWELIERMLLERPEANRHWELHEGARGAALVNVERMPETLTRSRPRPSGPETPPGPAQARVEPLSGRSGDPEGSA